MAESQRELCQKAALAGHCVSLTLAFSLSRLSLSRNRFLGAAEFSVDALIACERRQRLMRVRNGGLRPRDGLTA